MSGLASVSVLFFYVKKLDWTGLSSTKWEVQVSWLDMLAEELWKITGYRFMWVATFKHHVKKTDEFDSVHDNHPLKGGHTTWFWCSQDKAWKKAPKPSEKPNTKHCNHVGMKWYPCQSTLLVKYKRNKNGMQDIFIWLQHHVSHVAQWCPNASWGTPDHPWTRRMVKT